ncbi:hypothetical protein MC885_014521 [Smutsia gigantea]|nr:hypothetical protein MC885_014521 [Smutsia gigantea]
MPLPRGWRAAESGRRTCAGRGPAERRRRSPAGRPGAPESRCCPAPTRGKVFWKKEYRKLTG